MSDTTLHSSQLITIDKEILGGIPVFRGTRVPLQAMFDYLEAGDPLERFLDHFPSVEREQAVAVLEFANTLLIAASTKEAYPLAEAA
ncbi:MAG: DUF433 domain-containing protein [Candidatus Kapaibacterium sp.]|nr:MAG: DUF433 domain-containing protein [Candidatus Kapabacteria bacterium]